MEMYTRETSILVNKLERAEKLISGLASTKEAGLQEVRIIRKNEVLVGDAVMTAAFLSYAGLFRQQFVTEQLIRQIKYSKDWNFPNFLVKPVQFLQWSQQVIAKQRRRGRLMIDPQVQTNNWIKNRKRAINQNNLKELDFQNEI